jgi:predicted DNA-binding antitoxin AbrB/MazE fold protein
MQSTASLLIPGDPVMPITIEAVYENGVLKPKQPLALTEGTEVRLSVTPIKEDHDPLAAVIGIGEGVPDGAEDHDKYIYGTPRS